MIVAVTIIKKFKSGLTMELISSNQTTLNIVKWSDKYMKLSQEIIVSTFLIKKKTTICYYPERLSTKFIDTAVSMTKEFFILFCFVICYARCK